jgi:uncharacterized protein (DUF1499 family)
MRFGDAAEGVEGGPVSAAQTWGKLASTLAVAGAAVAVLLLVSAGPGTRWGWWHFRTGLGFLRWAAYASIAGAAIAVLALLLGGARGRAAVALVVALVALTGPLLFSRKVKTVPMIHDISTDTDDPPAFVAVLSRRAGAANPPEYDGAEVAAKQRAAYPDIQPIRLDDAPARAFERALAAARTMDWEIVASEPAEGRIEATATTRWFGFKDDIAIRVRPEGQGSRVDVRSKSRVGRSDLGANAARIRAFRQKL